MQRGTRRHGSLVAVIVWAACALPAAVAVPAAAQKAPPGRVHAYPAPGTSAASPDTGITFRGSGTSIDRLQVSGSVSGPHRGVVRVHRNGRGATFQPSVAFRPGERVEVRGVAVAGGQGDGFTFTVGKPFVDPGVELGDLHASRDATREPRPRYATRPDLDPPAIAVSTPATGAAPGVLLATPRTDTTDGVMLFDNAGQPLWYKKVAAPVVAGDLEKARYKGQDVLVWFEGTPPFGTGGHYRGAWTMVDSHYRTVATIRAANGYQADVHDIDITSDGHAYVEIYNPVVRDLTGIGGRAAANVFETVIQEIDIASGDLLFEWHSLDSFPVSDTVGSVTGSYIDYMHTNAVQRDSDGNILVSARNISAAFKINRSTSAVMWRLGGKRNQFRLSPADETGPSQQHDVQRAAPGIVSMFDNGVSRRASRGVSYAVDEAARTATRVREQEHVPSLFGSVHGNYQSLADGGSLVGWGNALFVTEYSPGGVVRWEAKVPGSYRTVRETWSGRPDTKPAVVVARHGASDTVAVSWNGATDVASWEVRSGSTRAGLVTVKTVPRSGFETAIAVPDAPFVQVRARAADQSVLGSSAVVPVGPWFSERPALSASKAYRPFTGDFTGGPGDDIFFYAPGPAAEYVWSAVPGGAFTATRAPAINGEYHPVVGDFVGDRHDDILWTRAGSGLGYLWRSNGVGSFASSRITVPPATIARVLPHQSAKAEVLWYNPGSGADRISRYVWSSGPAATAHDRPITVNGSYRPVVGDFDGNGWADVLWYGAGPQPDQYWRLTGTSGVGSTGQVATTTSVGGLYLPQVGRFSANGDQSDDIVWYGPGAGPDSLWAGTTGGRFVQTDRSNTATGTPIALRGTPGSIYLRAAGRDGPVWVPGLDPALLRGAVNTSFSGAYQAIAGDFEGGGTSGILWYAPGSGPERLFRPRLG